MNEKLAASTKEERAAVAQLETAIKGLETSFKREASETKAETKAVLAQSVDKGAIARLEALTQGLRTALDGKVAQKDMASALERKADKVRARGAEGWRTAVGPIEIMRLMRLADEMGRWLLRMLRCLPPTPCSLPQHDPQLSAHSSCLATASLPPPAAQRQLLNQHQPLTALPRRRSRRVERSSAARRSSSPSYQTVPPLQSARSRSISRACRRRVRASIACVATSNDCVRRSSSR